MTESNLLFLNAIQLVGDFQPFWAKPRAARHCSNFYEKEIQWM